MILVAIFYYYGVVGVTLPTTRPNGNIVTFLLVEGTIKQNTMLPVKPIPMASPVPSGIVDRKRTIRRTIEELSILPLRVVPAR